MRNDSVVEYFNNESELYLEVGKLIKSERLKSGLTQAELSERIQLSRSSLANIETGAHKLFLHVLYDISQALEKNIYDFLPPTFNLKR